MNITTHLEVEEKEQAVPAKLSKPLEYIPLIPEQIIKSLYYRPELIEELVTTMKYDRGLIQPESCSEDYIKHQLISLMTRELTDKIEIKIIEQDYDCTVYQARLRVVRNYP